MKDLVRARKLLTPKPKPHVAAKPRHGWAFVDEHGFIVLFTVAMLEGVTMQLAKGLGNGSIQPVVIYPMNNETPAPVGQSFEEWWKIYRKNYLTAARKQLCFDAWDAQEANIAALKAKVQELEKDNNGEEFRKVEMAMEAFRADTLKAIKIITGLKARAEKAEATLNLLTSGKGDDTCGQSIAARLEAGEQCFKALGEIIREPICEGDIERGREAFQAYKDATSAPTDGKRGAA